MHHDNAQYAYTSTVGSHGCTNCEHAGAADAARHTPDTAHAFMGMRVMDAAAANAIRPAAMRWGASAAASCVGETGGSGGGAAAGDCVESNKGCWRSRECVHMCNVHGWMTGGARTAHSTHAHACIRATHIPPGDARGMSLFLTQQC